MGYRSMHTLIASLFVGLVGWLLGILLNNLDMIRTRKKLKSKCPDLPVKELPGMVHHYFGISDATHANFQKPTQDFVKRLFFAVLKVCEGIEK